MTGRSRFSKHSLVPGLVSLVAFLLLLPLAGGEASAQPDDASVDCVLTVAPPSFGDSASDSLHAPPHDSGVSPHTAFHGQLLLGREAPYLYHLALFMTDPRAHPHNFQVVLEAEIASDGGARTAFMEDRGDHPGSIYSVTPEPFEQSSLMLDYLGHPPLRELPAAIFRGHFERQPNRRIVEQTAIGIGNVVHFREFIPGGPKLESLSYLLFGRGSELHMAHLLSAPPDFDQILTVEIEGEGPPAELLRRGLYVTLAGRDNDIQSRLRAGEELRCRSSGEEVASEVAVRVLQDQYCEAGEVGQVGFAPSRPCP